jgi:hypothetical protein
LSYETPRPESKHAALLKNFCPVFLPKLYRVRDLVSLEPQNYELIGSALVELNRLEPQEPSKQVRSWFHVIQGKHMENQNRKDRAIIHYRNAIDIFPHHKNEALFLLFSHYAAVGEFESFMDLKNRFFEKRRPPRQVEKLEELLRTKIQPKAIDPG